MLLPVRFKLPLQTDLMQTMPINKSHQLSIEEFTVLLCAVVHCLQVDIWWHWFAPLLPVRKYIHTRVQRFEVSKIFLKILIFVLSKGAYNWSKVAEKTKMSQKISILNKCWIMRWDVYWGPYQHIIIISEITCDTEDWSMCAFIRLVILERQWLLMSNFNRSVVIYFGLAESYLRERHWKNSVVMNGKQLKYWSRDGRYGLKHLSWYFQVFIVITIPMTIIFIYIIIINDFLL